MARKVFFSFHYQRDCWRVQQVRKSWVCRPGNQAPPFYDKAEWETIKRQGDRAIKNWIEAQLRGSSVTAVLIGKESHTRPYVLHEIARSYELGKGLVGIYIHNMKDRNGSTDSTWLPPPNPFDRVTTRQRDWLGYDRDVKLSEFVQTYDYVNDNGYHNLSSWIEEAARNARR